VSPTQKTDPVDACVLRESALLDGNKLGFIHREVNLYIPQKICHGHSDGKTFEYAKFLKHSLQQGYIAGLGRET
jgi:hypothetical protein